MANKQNVDEQNMTGYLISRFRTLISRFLRPPKKSKEGEVLDEFELNLDKLKKIMQEIDQKWMIVTKWNIILSNAETGENMPSIIEKGRRRGMVEAYNKKWIAFGMALTLYRLLFLEKGTNGRNSAQGKSQLLSRIKQFDPKLAKKIESLDFSKHEEPEIFGQLRGIMNNLQLITTYLKTHYDEVLRILDTFKDKKKATELRRIIIVLSNLESEELTKCIDDVRNWPYRSDRVAYGIRLFMERAKLFFNGGQSKYDGKMFLGFNSHFRDKELVSEMIRSPEVRRLIYYLKEIEFFRMAAYSIRKSVETQGKWEGFYEFYDNLDRGRNYIQMVRETFGNEDFARLLQAFKEKKHEAPVDWEKELEKLERDLENPVYADKVVIEAAANALVRIFEAKIKRLQEEYAAALKNFQKLLIEEDVISKGMKKFLKILAKKRKELKAELEIEELEFEALVEDVILAMPEFDLNMEKAMEIADTREELLAESRVLDASLNWRKFVLSNISPPNEGRATAGSYNVLRTSLAEVKIKSRVTEKHKESLVIIQDLIEFAQKQILSKLAECMEHINSKLKDYTEDVRVFLNRQNSNVQPGRILQFRTAGQGYAKGIPNVREERKVA